MKYARICIFLSIILLVKSAIALPLVGKKAPEWQGKAVIENRVETISLKKYPKRYKVLFFYPSDFTYVCPTELHAFEEAQKEFLDRNTQVIACSTDTIESHKRWLATPKSAGGIAGISYPIIADTNKALAKKFDVIDISTGRALRGTFIIDQNNIIQSALINNMSIGRNIEEILRIIDAIQFAEQHGEVCPANWHKGLPALKPTQEGITRYFSAKNGEE